MLSNVIPTSCEVLVVGAGPAGSACARTLALAGSDVLLVDQHHFPRDKICGDGLIPDAHTALRRLGAYDEVAALATHVPHVRCVAPRGVHIDVPGRIAVLPRKTLDHVLVRHAQAAGARLLTPLRFEAPLLDGEQVVGARLKVPLHPHGGPLADAPDGPDAPDERAEGVSVANAHARRGAVAGVAAATAAGPVAGSVHDIQARWVVLATGAVPQALTAAGLCDRHTPSGVALRGYIHHPDLAHQVRQLHMVWHPQLRGGYGWIFPAPGGVFNLGVGLTGSHRLRGGGHGQMQGGNLRTMLQAFGQLHAPAGELLRQGRLLGDFKGAPLRCTLQGARWSRPGLLVTGEAAGSTYAFTGEGIGKALETGILAAEALQRGRRSPDAAVRQAYEAALAALQPRFALYETAHSVNLHPWIADLVVWRARRSPRILDKLAGLLDESSNPGQLFTMRGVTRLMFG